MTKQILLGDDDPLLRRSLAFNLERDGYRPSTAANAEDLLALGRRDLPDLLLVPEEGRIAEWGKYSDLLARRGAHYRLYTSQLGQQGVVTVGDDGLGRVDLLAPAWEAPAGLTT